MSGAISLLEKCYTGDENGNIRDRWDGVKLLCLQDRDNFNILAMAWSMQCAWNKYKVDWRRSNGDFNLIFRLYWETMDSNNMDSLVSISDVFPLADPTPPLSLVAPAATPPPHSAPDVIDDGDEEVFTSATIQEVC